MASIEAKDASLSTCGWVRACGTRGASRARHNGAGRETFVFTARTEQADFGKAEGDRIAVQGSTFAMPSGFKLTDGVGIFAGAGMTLQYRTATFHLDTNTHAPWSDPGSTAASDASDLGLMTNNPVMHAADIIVA